MQPLVVTLAIDDEHQTHFDAERARYFPAGRTAVGAHVTLFHALPGEQLDTVRDALTVAARRAAFTVEIESLMPLGSGVAYRLRSPELDGLHSALRAQFRDVLTAQDAQGFRPHITVQNKVTRDVAQRTLIELQARFTPFLVDAVGLDLWRYAGGPWQPLDRFPFAADYR